jgi:hypothetical protein
VTGRRDRSYPLSLRIVQAKQKADENAVLNQKRDAEDESFQCMIHHEMSDDQFARDKAQEEDHHHQYNIFRIQESLCLRLRCPVLVIDHCLPPFSFQPPGFAYMAVK